MLSVAKAREVVLRHATPLSPRAELLAPDVLGQILAEDVTADIDSPPFDKAMMDGYAVRAADGAALKLVGEVQAGVVSAEVVDAGEAVRIFTGAPIPPGADAVVKQEDTTAEGERVTIHKVVKPGANVLYRGSEMRAGEVVVSAGTVLTPTALGVLAAAGRDRVLLNRVPPPSIAIIATGNELVDATEVPKDGQIRNTNTPMLYALAEKSGGRACDFHTHGDDRKALESIISDATYEDVTIISGGVSVGKYDLVPDVLKSLGVEVHFHKVHMKPGKPLLFGTLGGKLVFGLPGNPVSALLCFELFVGPAIRLLAGHTDPGPKELRLPLSESLAANHDRPTYHPAVVGEESVRPLPWKGSADLRALLPANGYVLLPPGEVKYDVGAVVGVIRTGGAA